MRYIVFCWVLWFVFFFLLHFSIPFSRVACSRIFNSGAQQEFLINNHVAHRPYCLPLTQYVNTFRFFSKGCCFGHRALWVWTVRVSANLKVLRLLRLKKNCFRSTPKLRKRLTLGASNRKNSDDERTRKTSKRKVLTNSQSTRNVWFQFRIPKFRIIIFNIDQKYYFQLTVSISFR